MSHTPCADCGATWGELLPNRKTPERIDGKRFGIDGVLCRVCYQKHRYRLRIGIGRWNREKSA